MKIASRCNLNCTYCFVYNRGDTRWRAQPKLMDVETAKRAAHRIVEHCQLHNKQSISIVYHGGEPLLVGLDHLAQLTNAITSILAPAGIESRMGMQSNGLLFTKDIGDFMLANRLTIGISIDGPPHINDRHRVDLLGRPSGRRLEEKLRLLLSDQYRSLFTGFLLVVDVSTDPVEVFDYLASWQPSGIDFILPYDHHDRLPPGKPGFTDAPYGEWMIKLFDHWFDSGGVVRIREFDSILRLILGGHSLVESIGTGPVDLLVIETNGDLEAVDSLKAVFDGATVLGLNVEVDSIDAAAAHVDVLARHAGAAALCETCQDCEIVNVCGGGYLPNRYGRGQGFLNPSVYCHDLQNLIGHIHRRTTSFFASEMPHAVA
jgi:uncharacterized protein